MKARTFENINLRAREAFIITYMKMLFNMKVWPIRNGKFVIDGNREYARSILFLRHRIYVMPRNYGFMELYASYDEYLTENSPEKALPPYSEAEFNELKEIFSFQTTASLLIDNLENFCVTEYTVLMILPEVLKFSMIAFCCWLLKTYPCLRLKILFPLYGIRNMRSVVYILSKTFFQ